MGNIGIPELALIFIVCLLVFGANKLPDIARTLARAIKEFKKAMEEGK